MKKRCAWYVARLKRYCRRRASRPSVWCTHHHRAVATAVCREILIDRVLR